jgi:hypothetical protein
MTRLYSVSDNSFHSNDFPWAWRIQSGIDFSLPPCPECDGPQTRLQGDMEMLLERKKGSNWPDIMGCGAYPLLIVSEQVLNVWLNDGVGQFPIGGRVSFLPPIPRKLEPTKAPAYFWLDGKQMLGAKLDFDASGFVGVQFCSRCGRRWDDVKATYDRQHSQPWSYVFVEGAWTGSNLFTTDLSPTAFFCTERVVECARKHQLTNFRFVPVEDGDAAGSPGVNYIQNRSASATKDPT